MTETALPTGTLVKREETSELSRISSFFTCIFFIISVKCLEFLTWEVVCPARGEMRGVMWLSLGSPSSSHCSCSSHRHGRIPLSVCRITSSFSPLSSFSMVLWSLVKLLLGTFNISGSRKPVPAGHHHLSVTISSSLQLWYL